MYLRQDVCFSPKGELFTLCATDAALTVNDVPIEGYAGQFYSRLAFDAQGVEWIITSGAGVSLLKNRVLYHWFEGAYGYGFSALHQDAGGLMRVYLMGPHDGQGACTVSVYTVDGLPIRSYQIHYASRGMIDVNPEDGTPISADRGPIDFEDMTLWDWMVREGNHNGNSNGGDTPNGSVGLVAANGYRLMAQLGQSLQLPPRLAAIPSRVPASVASGVDVPTAEKMPWEPFHTVPIVPPVVELPPSVIPPVLRAWRAWIVDTEGILVPRGNGISTADGPGPAYFEDALWVTPAMESTQEALYWGPEPPRNGVTRQFAYETCRDLAKRNGIPVCVNDEWGLSPTREWLGKFTQDGVRAVWLVEAYRPAGESQEDYRTRLRARLALAGDVYGVIPPYFESQGGGSEAESITTLNICREELALKLTPPVVIDLFGLRRAPRSAAREADAAAWIAATGQPESLRHPPVDPPKPPIIVVVPPVDPPVVPPPTLPRWVRLLILLLGQRGLAATEGPVVSSPDRSSDMKLTHIWPAIFDTILGGGNTPEALTLTGLKVLEVVTGKNVNNPQTRAVVVRIIPLAQSIKALKDQIVPLVKEYDGLLAELEAAVASIQEPAVPNDAPTPDVEA